MENTKRKKKTNCLCSLKIYYTFFLLWALLFCAESVYADSHNNQDKQQALIEIKGIVLDEQGEPLPGTTVLEKGTQNASVASVDGTFSIKVRKVPVTLTLRCLSFATKEITVKDTSPLTVQLMEDDKMLDEVVVIGYQTVTKREIHGSVSSINMKELESLTAPSVDVLLQGMVPGMNIMTNTGAPGAQTQIAIRGNTSLDGLTTSNPLIVLDGVIVDPSLVGFNTTSSNYFANINPSDIESIHVLKDASGAAIYGSRAANGVIQIFTKRGKTGKPQVSFNATAKMNMRPAMPTIYGGSRERQEKMGIFYNAADGNYMLNSYMPIILTDSLNPAFNNSTDWFKLYYNQSFSQDYNLAITGGDDFSNYRLSAGYLNEEGTIKGTGLDRFSFRGTFMNKLGRFTFNTMAGYTHTKNRTIYDYENNSQVNTTQNALNMDVNNMPSSLLYLNDIDKQVKLGEYDNTRNDNSGDNFVFSEEVKLDLTDYLMVNARYNFTTDNSRADYFRPAAINREQNAAASSSAYRGMTHEFNALINFNKEFGIHKLMGIVGIETQKTKRESTFSSGEYLSTDDVKIVAGVPQEHLKGGSTFSENALLSYFARAQYYLKDERYSLSLSIRRDGSSKFHKDNRWGYFPSAGAFWIISDEPFMEWSNKFLSMWKFRLSYGETGRHPSGVDYGYLSRYYNPGSYDGNVVTNPYYSDGTAQRDFTWEKSKEWNIGMDIDLYKSRYFVQLDVYSKETDGLYYTLALPNHSGYDYYNTNAVGVRNSGVELMARAMNVFPRAWKDWSLTLGGNISYNKNVITKLPFNNRTIINDVHYLSVGSPINQFYLSKYNGVFLTEGSLISNPFTGEYYKSENGTPYIIGDAYFEDVDGNYKWVSTEADRTLAGDPNPSWQGGINASLRFKNWTLEAYGSFVLDRDIWNQNMANTLSRFNRFDGLNEYGVWYGNQSNQYQMIKDYIARRMLIDLSDFNFYRPGADNSNAEFPFLSPYRGVANFWNTTSMYLEDGSYFKLNNITFSYTFDKLSNLPINFLRLSLIAENVAIIKNCRAADPQIATPGGIYTGNGYGLARTFSFKLLANF